MNIDLNRQEIRILIAWAEEATKGKFNMGDDASAMTFEEEDLIKKLRSASKAIKK